VIAAISKGQKFGEELARSNCEVAVNVARRLGLGTAVQRGLNEIYERWDGKGDPRKLAREDIAPPARFAQVASQAGLFGRLGGPELAVEVIRRRAGAALDPSIADAFLRHGRELLAEITSADASVAVIETEPEPRRWISEPRLDEVARAFADLVDLKSPFTHGHSVGGVGARGGRRDQSRPHGGRGRSRPSRGPLAQSRSNRRAERDLG